MGVDIEGILDSDLPDYEKCSKYSMEQFAAFFFKRFAHLMPNRKDPTQSLMGFGLGCRKGWSPLLYRLTLRIEKGAPEGLEIVQIKEKFGGLRYYVEGANIRIFDEINNAENESYKICECCGSEGELDESYHWVLTLCPECIVQRHKEKELQKMERHGLIKKEAKKNGKKKKEKKANARAVKKPGKKD